MRNKLRAELNEISFSATKKAELKAELNSAKATNRLRSLWQGTTEIPLSAGLLILAVVFLGVWNTYASIFIVDQTSALALLELNASSAKQMLRGVSAL